MMKNGARMLSAISRSNSSGVVSSIEPVPKAPPALLTRMSSGRPARPALSPGEQRVDVPGHAELGSDDEGAATGLLDRRGCLVGRGFMRP
jgi:hypothetical protein